MTATHTPHHPPLVSVIVPARNEEASLEDCLHSLVGQSLAATPFAGTSPAVEIIVVDDGSTDGTREIASSFSAHGVRLVEVGTVPPGWTGKNNAVAAGARAAHGSWLLFTDADTIHLPGSLGRSLEEATRHDAALLSYSPQQVVKSFAEKAVMPVIFAELAATFRPSLVSDPHSPAAAANGQYILITREAYDAVGGHGAVAGNLLEDVALARAVKQSGKRIFFRYAGDAVRTRMYRTFAQLREGWTKNLALLFPSPVQLAALRIIEFLLIVASFAIAIAAALHGHRRQAILAATLCLILYSFLWRRIRRAHFSGDANLLAIFGLPLFSYLLLRSARAHANGSVFWKGRKYSDETSLLVTGH